MKTMIIVETDYEREQFRKCWDAIMAEKAKGARKPDAWNFISSAAVMSKEGNLAFFHANRGDCNRHAIVYDILPDGWHIYNFNTLEEEVVPEGDLAGLCNSKAGNFPFFN